MTSPFRGEMVWCFGAHDTHTAENKIKSHPHLLILNPLRGYNKKVTDDDDLMIINKSGIAIRLHVDTIRVLGRATQGVRLINLGAKDAIAAVSRVPRADDEEEEGLEGAPAEGTPVEGAEGEVINPEAENAVEENFFKQVPINCVSPCPPQVCTS